MHVLRTATIRTAALVAASSLALASCGGSDDADAASGGSSSASESPSESSSEAASESPSAAEDTSDADAEYEIIDVTGESKDVGFDVMGYSTENNFTPPKDQAEFEKNVKFDKSLRPGSKAAYKLEGKENWFICVTHYDGSEPVSWAIFDATKGTAEGDVGAPTESWCP